MILNEEADDASTNKALLARNNDPEVGESASVRPGSPGPLPVVDAPPPPPYTPHTETTSLVPKRHRRRYSRARKRFIKALFMSCFIFLLLWALIASVFLIFAVRGRQNHHPPQQRPPVEFGECVPVTKWNGIIEPFPEDGRYYSNLVYSIPSDGEGFVIRSPSKMAFGRIEIASPKNYLGPTIRFHIRAGHTSMNTFQHLHACLTQLEDKRFAHTLYIAPFEDADNSREDIFFDIGILLPNKSFYGNVTHFPGIETNMPHFEHIIRRMTSAEYVRFKSASFTAVESPIIIEGLDADRVYARAERAEIDAVINATSSVHLHAPGGKIRAQLNITNEIGHNKSSVFMTTSGGTLTSSIRLHTNSQSGEGGVFNILARNSHASTTLGISEAPPDSTLLLDAFVSRGSLDVSLPPTFEGDFRVRSADPGVHLRRRLPDPTGRGRTREIQLTSPGTPSDGPKGSVRWLPREGEAKGNVTMSAPSGRGELSL